jgi:hypothetical protein
MGTHDEALCAFVCARGTALFFDLLKKRGGQEAEKKGVVCNVSFFCVYHRRWSMLLPLSVFVLLCERVVLHSFLLFEAKQALQKKRKKDTVGSLLKDIRLRSPSGGGSAHVHLCVWAH